MSKSPTTAKGGKKLPPIRPGKILLEDMKDEGISINGLAQAIRVPANRISLIVNEKRGITADTAARPSRYFGASTQYWLNIQNHFDLAPLTRLSLFAGRQFKKTAAAIGCRRMKSERFSMLS